MRRKIQMGFFFILFTCMLSVFMPSEAPAESGEALYPCLKELPGWKADKPLNASIDIGGTKMTNVTRKYQKEDMEFVVIFTSGAMAMASWMPYDENTNIKTPSLSISAKHINGYPVHIVEDRENHTSSMTILIHQGGADNKNSWSILTFSGTNIPKDKLVDMAKSFDWNCFKGNCAN